LFVFEISHREILNFWRDMKIYFIILALLMLSASVVVDAQIEKTGPVETVDGVELSKYAGKWYEIAKYPNKFQKKCIGNTTATYNLLGEGDIEVVNECLKKDGKIDTVKGKAKVVDTKTNAKLKVRFAPSWLSFISAVWGDYWIIDLDKEYQYAAVGDPDRKSFWILSRTPTLDTRTYQDILRRAETLGFEPLKVVETPQNVETIKGVVIQKPQT